MEAVKDEIKRAMGKHASWRERPERTRDVQESLLVDGSKHQCNGKHQLDSISFQIRE